MERVISNSQTGLGLWWSKLGKWQAMAATITLATFFIVLSISGNKEAVVITFAALALTLTISDKEIGLSKKVFLTSCSIEFLVILVPILLLG